MLSFAYMTTVSFTTPVTAKFDGVAYAKTLPGAIPLNTPGGNGKVWDPAGFLKQDTLTKEKVLFYREVEVKHSRLAMLASVGFPVAEQWHPIFKACDMPSYVSFQQSPLQTFWVLVVLAIAIPEIYSVQTFSQLSEGGQPWSIRADGRLPGDFNFDPLRLKDDDTLYESQTRELFVGRLAMIAIVAMVLQEVTTGSKLF